MNSKLMKDEHESKELNQNNTKLNTNSIVVAGLNAKGDLIPFENSRVLLNGNFFDWEWKYWITLTLTSDQGKKVI